MSLILSHRNNITISDRLERAVISGLNHVLGVGCLPACLRGAPLSWQARWWRGAAGREEGIDIFVNWRAIHESPKAVRTNRIRIHSHLFGSILSLARHNSLVCLANTDFVVVVRAAVASWRALSLWWQVGDSAILWWLQRVSAGRDERI